MKQFKSLTGVIHLGVVQLPDVRLNFHLNFGNGKEESIELKGEESKMIGNILNQALRLSPEWQELLINFADYLKSAMEKAQQGNGDGGQESSKE